MPARFLKSILYLLALLPYSDSLIAKPLKVFILAGQSNMQGHAHVNTFPYIGMDPKTAPMLKDMTNDIGEPVVIDDVHISFLSGKNTSEPEIKAGPLTAGFGSSTSGPKIGPEFTFGIYLKKHLKEPFLIIKTAWGGKSLQKVSV